MTHDFEKLTQYAKSFTSLTVEYESLLKEAGPQIIPSLGAVTETFYAKLQLIPETKHYLDERVESLQTMHTQ